MDEAKKNLVVLDLYCPEIFLRRIGQIVKIIEIQLYL